MYTKDFIKTIVIDSNDETFEELKKRLIGEYISFGFVGGEEITKAVFAEKIYDYFKFIESDGKPFHKEIGKFMDNWNDLVSPKIEKEPPAKKGKPSIEKSRARKYYEKAMGIKNNREINMDMLIDYSRIMMCLYTAIIIARYKDISDFNLAISELSIEAIISSMKTARETTIVPVKKDMFETDNLYSSDTCTFILTIMLLCHIKGNEVKGEF